MSGALAGKVILVTGGGAGIGRGVAEHCHACGAIVEVCSLETELAYPDHERINVSEVDVRETNAITAWVEAVAEQYGKIDGLVANAGVTLTSPFLETDLEEVETLWQVNLRGVYLSVQAVARQMVSRNCQGSIVNIASNHATASDCGYEMYAATKGGIVSMTRAMAWSLGEHSIRVNSLSPGLTLTEKVQDVASNNPELEALFNSWHATGQYNSVEQVAACAAFLLSDASAAVSGSDLIADQGMSARLAQFPQA